MSMTTIMAIDPASAKPNAYCISRDQRLIEYGLAKFSQIQDLLKLHQSNGDSERCILAIEKPYLGKQNPNTFAKLVNVNSRISQIGENLDWEVREYSNSVWTQSLGLHFSAKRKARKDAARLYARLRTGRTDLYEDVCDAIAICGFVESLIRIEKVVETGKVG